MNMSGGLQKGKMHGTPCTSGHVIPIVVASLHTKVCRKGKMYLPMEIVVFSPCILPEAGGECMHSPPIRGKMLPNPKKRISLWKMHKRGIRVWRMH
jgi:hypothetical protein